MLLDRVVGFASSVASYLPCCKSRNNVSNSSSRVHRVQEPSSPPPVERVEAQVQQAVAPTFQKQEPVIPAIQLITQPPVEEMVPAPRKVVVDPKMSLKRRMQTKPFTKAQSKPIGLRKTESPVIATLPLCKLHKEYMKNAVIADDEAITNETVTNTTPVFHAGHHMRVFEHGYFPGLILKLPRPSEGKKMLGYVATASEIVKKHNLPIVIVPKADIVSLEPSKENGSIVFVMEKLNPVVNTFSRHAFQEIAEREFEQFENSPELKAKWEKLFCEAAEFICLTGYWDTGWHNILPMKEGFGFIDFENVHPSKGNIATGIRRLFEMAPPVLFKTIEQVAKKYGVEVSIPEGIKEHLELRSRVRAWHKNMGITSASQKLDETSAKAGSIEKMIIEKCNRELDDHAEYFKGDAITARRIHWQPLYSRELSGKRKEFDCALKNLQEKQLLAEWEVRENSLQPQLASYDIYV